MCPSTTSLNESSLYVKWLHGLMSFVVCLKTYRLQGSLVIKLGDAVIPYHEDFKFYITTKLPNPHYTPETSTKVTLVNFTLSPRYVQLSSLY